MSFDVTGYLPVGTVVLEASAGTGKTWTIAALATRYVAEGRAELSQLLLATFSRAATHELRERVRERFVRTAQALGSASEGTDDPDPVVRHLATCSDQERARRRSRLLQALSQFDAATIATTHSFCQQVLDGLGMAGDLDPGADLVETVDDLVREVVDDLYLRKFAHRDAGLPLLSVTSARAVARAAVADGQAQLEPADAEPDSAAGQRVGLGRAARLEVARRKRAGGLRGYDDLLTLLRDVLVDPVAGPPARARLREQFQVVLVDEFQDTDPVQWEILHTAFHGHTTLVLIGDPKQAVYAFRGAEVLSYLEAVAHADAYEGLEVNRRTDAAVLTALDRLYGGAALGHPRIVVRPVVAAHQQARLTGTPPLRLRVVDRSGAGPLGKTGFPAINAVRRRVAIDVAADIVELLDGPARLLSSSEKTLQPGDVAVLVRKRAQGELVQRALEDVGVPSVLGGGGSVFGTQAARDWLWFLQALEQPHRAGLLRLAALSSLLGWSAEQLDTEGDQALDQIATLVRAAARDVDQSGVAAAFERVSRRTGLESRVLAFEDGERRLTDLRHLAQLLQAASIDQSLGLSSLVAFLDARVQEPDSGGVADRSRRLESDAAAVQILTVHASKGLEFPIVYVPFGWDGARNPEPDTLRLHDADGRRLLDVGGKGGPGWQQRQKRASNEDDDEELRLFYVAVTRAACSVVLWWAPAAGTAGSPLHRLLFARTDGVAEPVRRAAVPDDQAALSRLRAWGWPDEIIVQEAGLIAEERWTGEQQPAAELAAARFDRLLDRGWRRTSYSALTAAAHDAGAAGVGVGPGVSAGAGVAAGPGVGSEPEDGGPTDEPELPAAAPAAIEAPDGPASTMNDLPSGAAFGTIVHRVLEQVETGGDDLLGQLQAQCEQVVGDLDAGALAQALLPVLHTPLDDSGVALADMADQDRLAELDFELPLSGGDDPLSLSDGHGPYGVQASLHAVAELVRSHLPADDALVDYPDRLAQLDGAALRGYLTGSIDAVLRRPGPRYVVVDYKTNRLGRGDLTALHYTREAMAQEMLRAHYPLQALLYAVALHRYLRWRQPGYVPEQHLGGVQYLFVRGMVGRETPLGCGVFDWQPPAALVTELSDLLAGTS